MVFVNTTYIYPTRMAMPDRFHMSPHVLEAASAGPVETNATNPR
jgi:hypothetical protein